MSIIKQVSKTGLSQAIACPTCNGNGCDYCDYDGTVNYNHESMICPVSQTYCQDYKDCETKSHCWLK